LTTGGTVARLEHRLLEPAPQSYFADLCNFGGAFCLTALEQRDKRALLLRRQYFPLRLSLDLKSFHFQYPLMRDLCIFSAWCDYSKVGTMRK